MRIHLIFLLVVLCSFFSCQKNSGDHPAVSPEDTLQSNDEIPASEDPTVSESNCYAYRSKQDTILLLMEENANAVTGTLDYRLFEKDKNNGTIQGKWKGDTLFAVYKFMSEGMNSQREVVFLRQGNSLIEGYGPMEENDGIQSFTADGELSFPGTFKLEPMPCDQ